MCIGTFIILLQIIWTYTTQRGNVESSCLEKEKLSNFFKKKTKQNIKLYTAYNMCKFNFVWDYFEKMIIRSKNDYHYFQFTTSTYTI